MSAFLFLNDHTHMASKNKKVKPVGIAKSSAIIEEPNWAVPCADTEAISEQPLTNPSGSPTRKNKIPQTI